MNSTSKLLERIPLRLKDPGYGCSYQQAQSLGDYGARAFRMLLLPLDFGQHERSVSFGF